MQMHITCSYTFAAPAISLPKAGTCRHIIQLFHGKLWLEEAAQSPVVYCLHSKTVSKRSSLWHRPQWWNQTVKHSDLRCMSRQEETQIQQKGYKQWKVQRFVWKLCPWMIQRLIRLSWGAQPQIKVWLPERPLIGKFSQRILRTLHCF